MAEGTIKVAPSLLLYSNIIEEFFNPLPSIFLYILCSFSLSFFISSYQMLIILRLAPPVIKLPLWETWGICKRICGRIVSVVSIPIK